jgi:hypothetical protein
MAARFSSRDPEARPASLTNPDGSLHLGNSMGGPLGVFVAAWQLASRRLAPEQALTIRDETIEIDSGSGEPRVIPQSDVHEVVGFEPMATGTPAVRLADGSVVALPPRIFPEPMGPFATPYVKRRFAAIHDALTTTQ